MEKKRLCYRKKILAVLLAVSMLVGAGGIPDTKAQAAFPARQTLTVDLTDTTGEILHGASGFLYGVSSEEVPTTNTMVPLKPKVLCTKGALGTEHPYGDALDVAKSFLESGGEQVMMYNSNYYGVFGVTANHREYADVLKNIIAPAVVAWKEKWKAEHATDNLRLVDIDKALVYIPINEGTPKNDTGFNQAWEAYYDAIREADPEAVIAGPNSAAYNEQFTNDYDKTVTMRSHIQYCADHDCMPDVITWHDLQTDKLERLDWEIKDFTDIWNTTDWTRYKKDHPEEFPDGANIPVIPQICINEYADYAECGVPGRLVNWIARLEDQKIYGCLPFWHQANNLNDLTADANQGNGAWWLYKWYGDMSGQTVKVTTSTSYEKLYGMASIDDTKKIATALLGGVDGRADVDLKNVVKTKAFAGAKTVHVKVQSTAFSGYHGAKEGTETILEGAFPVNEDGSVRITLDNMKFSTAYNVTVTEAGEGEEASDPLVNVFQRVYEAEEAVLGDGCNIKVTEDYNPKYYISADRFVEMPKGAELAYQFEVPTDGKYRLDFIYGNGTGSERNDMGRHNPQNVVQTFSVDGGEATQAVMANTLLDSMTGIWTMYADLAKGAHTIRIRTVGNGRVTHDSLTVTWHGAKSQAVKGVKERYEAEQADFNMLLSNSDTTVRTETKLGGYSSNGYVTGLEGRSVQQGGGVRWNVVVAESGLYNLTFRYQASNQGNLNLYIGNTAMDLKVPDTRLSMKKTNGQWESCVASVYLQKGINIIDVDTTRAAALDYMQVQETGKKSLAVYETAIEAEDCIPANSAIQIGRSGGASGGKYVVGMKGDPRAAQDADKYLEMKYNAPQAGVYQMRVYQSNNDICGTHWYNTKIIDKYATIEVNGQEAKRYFFINTFSDDTFKEKSIPIHLKEGENTIKIYNDDSWHVTWGGTTATPGTNKLENYAPNFDRFVITPSLLEDPVVLPEEFGIQLSATSGGYVTADKNRVEKGGQFQVTAVPDLGSSLVSISCDGEDVTERASKLEDGAYSYTVPNVQDDVKVEVRFAGGTSEYQDKYVKNAGFGAGNTDGWEALGVTVKKSSADSLEGYYAVLSAKGRLSQTVSLPAGKYALSVYSKGKGNVTGAARLEVSGVYLAAESGVPAVDITAPLEDYVENRLAFTLTKDGQVTICADAAGLHSGEVLLDNVSIDGISRDPGQISEEYLYLVDCGDFNPDTVGEGEKFGQYNHVTDQAYQEDIRTGKKWGVVTSASDPEIGNQNTHGGAGVYTKFQWAYESQSGESARTKSFRYAHNQLEAGIQTRYVKYRFELEPGEYKVAVGLGNTWDNAANPDVYAGVGNPATDKKLNQGALQIPKNGSRVTEGSVIVGEGQEALDVYALSSDPTIQVNYIQISQIGAQADAPVSLAIASYPEKTSYLTGEAFDPTGLQLTVTYQSGQTKTVGPDSCKVEGFDSQTPGQKEVTISYTERGVVVKAALLATVEKRPVAVSEDPGLLYFVDCGDFDPETTSEGDAVSKNQSVTDKVYGEDVTGISWGVVTTETDEDTGVPESVKTGSNAAYTRYQWANERQVGDTEKTESFRYAHGQDTANILPRYVRYRFAIEPGEYLVRVGMGNTWGNAANPDVYAGVGTPESDMKLHGAPLQIKENQNVEAKGMVTVDEGQEYLEVYALSEEPTIQMNYIYIEAPKEPPVSGKSLEKLRITPPVKTVYGFGEDLDPSGMEVEAIYSDGTEKTLSQKDYTITGYMPDRLGSQILTVSYTEDGRTAEGYFAVRIQAAKLVGLVLTPPQKLAYLYNETQTLQTKGMAVQAVYSDGTKIALELADCDITGFHGSQPGKQVITVTYREGSNVATASFEITVKEETAVVPVSLALTKPKKVTYQVGQKLDVAGMTLTVFYSNGSKKPVKPSDCSITGFDSSKEGVQKITVTYTEQGIAVTAMFEATVKKQQEASGKKYKITYKENGGGKVSGMPSDSKTYQAGQDAKAKAAPLSTSKFFAGWNTKKNGKGKSYAPGDAIQIKGNVVLYAQWKSVYTASNKLKYQVTGKKTVCCKGTANKKATSIKVPSTIRYKGVTYRVTAVASKAFANNRSIRTVSIGNQVKAIKSKAFYQCKNLKKVTIGTALTTIEKYAFSAEKKGCTITIKSKKLKTVKTAINHKTRNMVIKVPKSKVKAYQKLFAKKAKGVTVRASK
ncbi:bacterial Ig-like domain-containing protein [Lachnospiraceae bacterium 29-84]